MSNNAKNDLNTPIIFEAKDGLELELEWLNEIFILVLYKHKEYIIIGNVWDTILRHTFTLS